MTALFTRQLICHWRKSKAYRLNAGWRKNYMLLLTREEERLAEGRLEEKQDECGKWE